MSRTGLVPYDVLIRELEDLRLAEECRVTGSNLRAVRDFDGFTVQRAGRATARRRRRLDPHLHDIRRGGRGLRDQPK